MVEFTAHRIVSFLGCVSALLTREVPKMGRKVTECTCLQTHQMIESDVEARQGAPVTGEIMRR